ncbi:2-(3-amino-3-carboxypropyl)histidine synthase subunit 1, partial [Bienertia sinuspersici]
EKPNLLPSSCERVKQREKSSQAAQQNARGPELQVCSSRNVAPAPAVAFDIRVLTNGDRHGGLDGARLPLSQPEHADMSADMGAANNSYGSSLCKFEEQATMAEITAPETTPQPPSSAITTTQQTTTKPQPKRFIRNQIPASILNNPSLNSAISLLPQNYNFEIHKCVHRILSLPTSSPKIALQLPEGLLMYSLSLSDIFRTFASASDVFVLGDVTYGACCIDDLSASALGADLLIHYGHSCLVPVDSTVLPCMYVFVEIGIDVSKLVKTLELNDLGSKSLAIAGTIQFAGAIRGAKVELEKLGFRVLVPQSKPLSAGEVLGCTAPRVSKRDFGDEEDLVIVFVADGRFHLEAFMIANPGVKTFRYDPYLGRLFLEEYDHKGMKYSRKKAILKAKEKEGLSWGIVLGTLGRQGNPRILERLEKTMEEKGMSWTVVLMSEISPARIALFEDSIDAWIQIACPRLSIDWGEAFKKPLLTPFEAEIALGLIPGWWGSDDDSNDDCGKSCGCDNGSNKGEVVNGGHYPMDYYAQDGGEWNSCYTKGKNRPTRRNLRSSVANESVS